VHRFAAAAFGLTLTLGAAALFLSAPGRLSARAVLEPRPAASTATSSTGHEVGPTTPEDAPSAAPVDPSDPALDEGGPGPVTPAPVTSARTSIVVLRLADAGVELVTRVTKPFACPPGEPPTAGAITAGRWRLVDRASGALLAEGALALPRLCECPKGRDHRRGCVVVHHSAVVRLKLPRLAAQERLELVGAEGPVGNVDLPEAS